MALDHFAQNAMGPNSCWPSASDPRTGDRIADPLITQFERREIRNHMKECDAELRRCLQMMSERIRFRTRSVEDVGDSFAKPSFRLLA